MDAAQWPKALVYDFHQEIGLVNPSGDNVGSHSKQDKKKTRLNKDQALNCPRCNSANTKFCYYNNYNPTQPRYLCKACRRYWTHGGTLRNVPVGGSSRKKNKPPLALAPAPSQSNNTKLFLHLNPKPTTMSANFLPPIMPSTRSFMHENHDLNMGLFYANPHHFLPVPPTFELSPSQGALSSYHHAEPNTRLCPSLGFHFQDIIKPALNLCKDSDDNRNMEGAGRIQYPFRDQLKQDSTTSILDLSDGITRDSNNGVVYWNNHGLYN